MTLERSPDGPVQPGGDQLPSLAATVTNRRGEPEAAVGGLQFVVQATHRRPGGVRISVVSDCPVCDLPLKLGGRGYPDTVNGNLNLHHWRCLPAQGPTRREIAIGRSRPEGLPRGVQKATRVSACAAACGHTIAPGHLIERMWGGWGHVKCPTICVRCEMPINPGQAFSPRMPRQAPIGELRQAFGWKHRICDYEDLQARIAHDEWTHILKQIAKAKRLADNRAGVGSAFQRQPAESEAPPVPNPGRISLRRLH